MMNSQNLKASVSFVGDGTTNKFYFGFDYINKHFVKVQVGAGSSPLTYLTDYTVDDRSVTLTDTPAVGVAIRVYRETPSDRIVEWADGAFIKASQMTLENLQLLHLMEEAHDYPILNSLTNYPDGFNFNALGHRITNVKDPKDSSDVVTKHYMESVQNGFVQQNTALANTATEAAGKAKDSSELAKKWAMSTVSPDGMADTDSPTGYTQSAKIWAALSKEYAGLSKFKLPIGYYNSVSEMRVSETAIVGRPCVTLGYYEPNDGGGAVYIIRQKKESDVDDGGSVIFLDNGNVSELIIDGAINVKQFGAKGDGTTDDTTSINSALALGKNTVFPKATYLVSSPLILQPYTCVDLCSSIIVGSNADADIFLFSRELNPTESLTLQNGIIRGKYTNAIHLKGENEWGHAPSNYAQKVRIDNILAYCDTDAPDENTFLFLDTACKRLNITRCGAETKNCIISNGKTVETFISGCMLYATGNTGYAVKIYSDFTNGNGNIASGWMYPEGMKIVNCEIDNPNNTANAFTISDGFVTLVENCYIGCGMSITPPTKTTANTDIVIANNIVTSHTISIGDKTKNNIYRCRIENNVFDDSRVYIYESSTISVSNNTFYGSNTYDTAVYIGPNTNKIEVHDNCIYGNFKIGVMCKDSPIEAAVYNINYNGIGNQGLYIENATKNTVYRHHIRGGEIPVMYTAIPVNSEIDVGGTIASATVSLAKGQAGYITGVIYTTEDTSGARIMVDAPGKIGILQGEGWSTRFIYVNNGTRRIPIRIPFKCTDDFSGTITLINGIEGKSVKITTTYHSYFGVELT
jgi:hypothetical protein